MSGESIAFVLLQVQRAPRVSWQSSAGLSSPSMTGCTLIALYPEQVPAIPDQSILLIINENGTVDGSEHVFSETLQQTSIDSGRRVSFHVLPRGGIQPISMLSDFLD